MLNTQIPVPHVANTAAESRHQLCCIRPTYKAQLTGEMARDGTESRDKDDPESTLTDDVRHAGVVEVLLFVLFCCASKAVFECVEVAELQTSISPAP